MFAAGAMPGVSGRPTGGSAALALGHDGDGQLPLQQSALFNLEAECGSPPGIGLIPEGVWFLPK